MKNILLILTFLTLAACKGTDGMGLTEGGAESCGQRVASVWYDDGGAILDLSHISIEGPETYQFLTNNGLFKCEATAVVYGNDCSGTINVMDARMISGPPGEFSSQCEETEGTYSYNIDSGYLTYGRQNGTRYRYR